MISGFFFLVIILDIVLKQIQEYFIYFQIHISIQF